MPPRQPSDMVLRGPPYPWIDYAPADGIVEEMERMLTQIFTDRDVLQFFLDTRSQHPITPLSPAARSAGRCCGDVTGLSISTFSPATQMGQGAASLVYTGPCI